MKKFFLGLTGLLLTTAALAVPPEEVIKASLVDNHVSETVTDPNKVLTHQISRVFDAVNRLQLVTGAAQ